MVVHVLIHEAREGRETPHRQKLHVTGVAVAALLPVRRAGDEGLTLRGVTDHEVDKLTAMGQDVAGGVPAARERAPTL